MEYVNKESVVIMTKKFFPFDLLIFLIISRPFLPSPVPVYRNYDMLLDSSDRIFTVIVGLLAIVVT